MSKQANVNSVAIIVKIASIILTVAPRALSLFSYVIQIHVLIVVYQDFMAMSIQENVFNVHSLA